MKGLLWLAVAQGALLLGVALLIARGLGWFETWEEMDWRFENPTLLVQRGERTVVKPIEASGARQRFTFTAIVGEPEARKDPALPIPYAVAAVETRLAGSDAWQYDPADFVRALPLVSYGAPPREWLQEIRPVLERGPDGSARLLFRAEFRHETGMRVAYYHDPERRIPGFGWVRQERMPQDREQPAIYHAFPDTPVETLAEDGK